MKFFRRRKTNYGKIIAISIAVVAVASIIAFVVYKLVKKYTESMVYDCDDLLDECDECDAILEGADEDIDEIEEA